MQSILFASETDAPQQSSSGKTSPASSAPKTTHSAAFWERLPAKIANSSRQGSDGRTLVVCLDPREQSRGASSMPNISAWPNAALISACDPDTIRELLAERDALAAKVERDEDLLRQALEALESSDWYIGQLERIVYSPDDTGTHEERAKVQSTIAALRERLGEGAEP